MDKPTTKAEKRAAYDAWYLAEIDKGLEDIEAGRVIPHEQVKAEMQSVLKKLHEQYGQKAA
ncbi:MAG: hypothetical protein U0989_16735 [Azonexus sp.]|nr:hypothetical protein [Azonexus sp.]MDZ4316400.1 hypothetical protein [Azonexus sp.]